MALETATRTCQADNRLTNNTHNADADALSLGKNPADHRLIFARWLVKKAEEHKGQMYFARDIARAWNLEGNFPLSAIKVGKFLKKSLGIKQRVHTMRGQAIELDPDGLRAYIARVENGYYVQ